MKLTEKATVRAFHRHRLGGTSLQALGFRGPESQVRRFEALCTWGDFSGCSILDLGCGYGDLKPFLDQRYEDIIYLGVDFLQEFVDGAQASHGHLPNTQFFHSDFLTAGLPEVDIVIASGSLNYRSENILHPWQMITRMWEAAGKGVVFNLLDAKIFGEDEVLCGYDIDEVSAYCKKLDAQTKILNDYLPDDFTVLMRKS
ncbi:class I SAM-dependent methyltransferase [Undibacterium sp. TJN19]|uniref:class I SAM-dependent methyltransferase n=1 Tax=Undibacterium sp. TJN19 TaxID=3413055 RepID=UPI003BEF4DE4